jgi:hypothetical protein
MKTTLGRVGGVWFEVCERAQIPHFVIAALVAAIHRSTSAIQQDGSTLHQPWITGTSPVMTI